MCPHQGPSSLRRSGLHAIGNVAWGSHLCLFYERGEDLLDLLVSYFRAGLEANERCLWITCEPLDAEQALQTLRKEFPDATQRLAAGDIEILPHEHFYLEGGCFDARRVIRSWETRHECAVRAGYAGLRVNVNDAWLTPEKWAAFSEYEHQLDRILRGQRTLALCAYPLTSRPAAAVFDVADAHQAVIARRDGRWSVLETPDVQPDRCELERLNGELEARVTRRTRELAHVIGELRRESEHRSLTAEALSDCDQRFREIAENIRDVFWVHTPDIAHAVYVNPAYERVWGRPREADCGDRRSVLETIHPEDRPRIADVLMDPPAGEFSMEYRIVLPDGGVRWIRDRRFPIRDPSGWISRFAGIAEDLTDRKRAEDRLVETTVQLRALSAKAHAVREEEAARIAREIHDELGSALTSLKWNLEGVERDLPTDTESAAATVREKLRAMISLSEDAIEAVRRIASDMRPTVLDGLGLAEAIQWQVRQFETRSGLRGRCLLPEEPLGVTPDQATVVFRILQEALTNVMKHANATRVTVEVTQDERTLVLVVRDDGRGLCASAPAEGRQPLGILGMHERARLVGGTLTLTSTKDRETKLSLCLPLSLAPESRPLPHASAT